jgi:hypothetical protein
MPEPIFIIASDHGLGSYVLESKSPRPIEVLTKTRVHTLDFDYQTKRVCWKKQRRFKLMPLEQDLFRTESLIYCGTVNHNGSGFANNQLIHTAMDLRGPT